MAANTIPYTLTKAEIDEGVISTSITYEDILLEPNFKMQITGPSMSGKSRFILRLIEHRDHIFRQKFERIIYCTHGSERTSMVKEYIVKLKEAYPRLEVVHGLPNIQTIQTGRDTLVSTRLYELKPMTT
jgi:GTPase SAR1 family protein